MNLKEKKEIDLEIQATDCIIYDALENDRTNEVEVLKSYKEALEWVLSLDKRKR